MNFKRRLILVNLSLKEIKLNNIIDFKPNACIYSIGLKF